MFGAVLLALGGGAWWIVRVGLRPLDAIGVTAGAIAAGDLSRRVDHAEPRTEVGRLGLSLNAMLARLEEAFAERRASEERLRRFLADASHELRTPLASIRGYAELFRIGAAAQPEDVAKAMTRIEDESARMGVLVEDLLALARLDELPEPVREPVDLTALAADAVDDARAVAPGRDIVLAAPDGAVVVDGDPGQLRQVLANLMRNALVHTPAGTRVEVSIQAREGPRACRCATSARACRPRIPPSCSIGSGAETVPPAPTDAGAPAPGSAWRSSRRSSRRTAAPLGRPTPGTAGRASRYRCRCAPRRAPTHRSTRRAEWII